MHGNDCYWQGIYSIEEVKTYVVSFNLILILIDINLTKFFSGFSFSTIRICIPRNVENACKNACQKQSVTFDKRVPQPKQSKRAIRLDSPKRSHANKCF